MRGAAAALVVAAVLALSAVPASAGDVFEDPCKLLNRREIAKLVEQPAGKGRRVLSPMLCQWQLAGTATRAAGQVNALVERGRRAKDDFATAKLLLDAQLVSDLGRAALYTPSSGTLWVLEKGPALYYVQLNVYDVDGIHVTDGLLDVLVDLATRAQTRL